MLILTRKVGQSIHVGENIVITIVAVDTRGQPQVRVGVTAPQEIAIDREEIAERKRRGRKADAA